MKGSFDLGEQWPWPHGSDIRQAKAGGATHMCCVLNFKAVLARCDVVPRVHYQL